jgi:hypothetical protein
MKTVRQVLSLFLMAAALASASAAPSAEKLMEEAKQKAASEGKNVFLVFSTTGCAWCKVLKSFIESDDIKPVFTKYFVPVQLMLGNDANTNPGASAYDEKYGPSRGVPFHAFITPDGKEIIDSNENGDGGNIGYPLAPNEIAWFMAMLKKAAPKMSADELKTIETKLKNFKKT